MSVVQNIMSIFGAKPGNVAPPIPGQSPAQNIQQAQMTNNPANNPAPQGTQQTPGTAANGVIPQQEEVKSPTEPFKDLWQPTPIDPNKTPEPSSQLTAENFMQAAGKIDFTQALSPEQLQKIQAGGPEAAQVLLEVMNKTAQVTMGQTLAGANKLIERQVSAARNDFNKNIPRTVRDSNVREALFQQNKMLSDPAVAPLVVAMQQQFSEKFPMASEAELLEKAQQYVLAAGNAFAPPKETPKQAVPASEDFSDIG